MPAIVVSTWIPRSDTHVYEIAGKQESIGLEVYDLTVNGGLSFNVKSRSGREIEAKILPYGLFTFKSEFKEVTAEKILEFKKEVRELLIEDIFKPAQAVTYQQIKDGILPIGFHATVFDGGVPMGLQSVEASEVKVYFDMPRLYSTKSNIYVNGSVTEDGMRMIEFLLYTVLGSNYVNTMVETMSKVYNDMVDVEGILEEEDFKDIRETMISIAALRKRCSERYGKLKQAVSNFKHTHEIYDEMGKTRDQEELAKALDVKGNFQRLYRDSDYIIPLWRDVLITDLENLNFIVNTRLGMQTSIETQKEEKEMKLLQAIFLVGVISSIIALGAMPGAELTLYSPEGSLIAHGKLVSFKVQELMSFGVIAIIVSILFFLLFNYVYMRLSSRIFGG
ncbi:MAG: hypothetical protein GF416_00610 [Candidatus Altiarchaeales archaeon]|nr:hypothetical protein [Candidatus Altiarchaeales archaeon]MBD3415619.1 hypothetical protein [Candidatus Altiarchaeales archaeon]